MKLSNYNVNVKLEGEKHLLYNTLSRKYLVYDANMEKYINNLDENLNKSRYELYEAEIIKQLYEKKIIIDDNYNELEWLKLKENCSKFQEQAFYLTIQPTLDCNFRCVYCYEQHKQIRMDECTFSGILNFIKKVSTKVRKIHICWFGGEPLLEFDLIEKLTTKIIEICNDNNCNYMANIVTNGYLLTDTVISKLKILKIRNIQITLDGPKLYHDVMRPHLNGTGTFDVIHNNILNLLEFDKEIHLVFRVNANENNYKNIDDILNLIPEAYRNRATFTMANLFQIKNKISLYDTYIKAIDMGYLFYNTGNSFSNRCDTCKKNSISIEPTGKLAMCSPMAEKGLYYGTLSEDGNIKYSNIDNYVKFQNLSVFDSENCTQCTQLPMCSGGCKYSKYVDKNVCNGNVPDGLTLEQKIKLHYYSDLKNNNF